MSNRLNRGIFAVGNYKGGEFNQPFYFKQIQLSIVEEFPMPEVLERLGEVLTQMEHWDFGEEHPLYQLSFGLHQRYENGLMTLKFGVGETPVSLLGGFFDYFDSTTKNAVKRLGYPTQIALELPEKKGFVQNFERGVLFEIDGQVLEVSGMFSLVLSNKSDQGLELGYPLSQIEEFEPNHLRQRFEFGTIYYGLHRNDMEQTIWIDKG